LAAIKNQKVERLVIAKHKAQVRPKAFYMPVH
jgi:hypothetical protein